MLDLKSFYGSDEGQSDSEQDVLGSFPKKRPKLNKSKLIRKIDRKMFHRKQIEKTISRKKLADEKEKDKLE